MDLTLFQNETYKKNVDSKQAQREARITVNHNSTVFFLNKLPLS